MSGLLFSVLLANFVNVVVARVMRTPRRTHWEDTLRGHIKGTHSGDTLGRHTEGTDWDDTLGVHIDKIHSGDTLGGHTGRTH